MIGELVDNASQYVQTSPWLAVVAVFLGGVVTASNPCVLVMIPLMMSFVAGRKEEGTGVVRALGYSGLFILGQSITFTALGVFAALAGTLFGDVSGVWTWIVAGVCLVMGAHLLGLLPFAIPMPFQIQPKTTGALGAFLLGLLFGIVCTPCAAPILVVLLTYLAGSGASVVYGGLLLLVYSLGHSVLILLAGTSVGLARRLIESKRVGRVTVVMRRVAGGLVVLVGVYFVFQALS